MSTGTFVARRQVLRWAGCGIICGFARGALGAAHFWETKQDGDWSPAEIAELAGNSPWGRAVSIQYRGAMDNLRPQADTGPGGRGVPGTGECGLVPCVNVMPGKANVTWESALPIRQALRSAIPQEFQGHYVLAVRGLQGEQTLERLQAASDLVVKGKPPLQCGLVVRRNGTYLFGFLRELLPVEVADKEVVFTVRTGARLEVTLLRAVFTPREMIYRGVIAL